MIKGIDYFYASFHSISYRTFDARGRKWKGVSICFRGLDIIDLLREFHFRFQEEISFDKGITVVNMRIDEFIRLLNFDEHYLEYYEK